VTFAFLLVPAAESATSPSPVIEQSHGKEPQLRTEVQRAREYELMVIFAPDVPEEELQGAVDRVSSLVSDAGGNVTLVNRESPWGRRRLAYPIRHESRDVRDGIYALYYFELDAARVIELERDLKLTANIIRYMVTHQVAAPMAPPEPEVAEVVSPDGEPAATAEAFDDAVNLAPESAPDESVDEPAPDETVEEPVPGTAPEAAAEDSVDGVAEDAEAADAGDDTGTQG
jgi:small subunit ribosomal protein S6